MKPFVRDLLLTGFCFALGAVVISAPEVRAQNQPPLRTPALAPSVEELEAALSSNQSKLANLPPDSLEAINLRRRMGVLSFVKARVQQPPDPNVVLPTDTTLRELMTNMGMTIRILAIRGPVTDFLPLKIATTEVMAFAFVASGVLPVCVAEETDQDRRVKMTQQYQMAFDKLLSKLQEVKGAIANEDTATIRIKVAEVRRYQQWGHTGGPGPFGEPSIPGFQSGCIEP